MKAKKRYILTLLCVAFLMLCYFGWHRLKRKNPRLWKRQLLSVLPQSNIDIPPVDAIFHDLFVGDEFDSRTCRLETCFNLTRCRDRPFRVYVYPIDDHVPPTENYQKVLNVLYDSPYYTEDPHEACLFVLSLDTLDRDRRSERGYVRNMQARFQGLDHWNGGQNHVIFNLYSGTFPDYTEDLGFDIGRAILAKASIANTNYRPGFDISIPLFHNHHPERGGEPGLVRSNGFPVNKTYFVAFKGKRYVYGIGSETRDSLYHLHNGGDIVLLTTCKHNKDWKNFKDERCDIDNKEYDRWDYNVLLSNTTFCLVPRGRRLGSFRFLETLQAGCIPVVLSNGWQLPFAEVIDWSEAVVTVDERRLLQVTELLRSIPPAKIFAMRQQTQILWDRYLSSIYKIVSTTIEILRERISSSHEGLVWNSDPGALLTLSQYSDTLGDFPVRGTDNEKFSAVIYVGPQETGVSLHPTAPLGRLVQSVAASKFVEKILLVWASNDPILRSQGLPVPLHVITDSDRSPSARFRPRSQIETSAILSLDSDAALTTDEIDFAFVVWRDFPDRIVGFPARAHYWDSRRQSWSYTSKWMSEYSMVLTGAAFYHRYYNHLYTHWLSPLAHKTVDQTLNCEDILMNFLVSHVTKRPPIKVTQRKQFHNGAGNTAPWTDPDHFTQRQSCLNTFTAVFGYMPLLKSSMRLDPILYKDNVAHWRKKYRMIEQIPIS